MADKRRGSSAGPGSPSPIAERSLISVARILVNLVVVVLLFRTLVSSLEGGPGTEQAFAAGVLAALVLVQSPRR